MPGARVASGQRVTMRTFEREDVPFLSRNKANPELRLRTGNTVTNQAQLEEAFEKDADDTSLLICLDDDGAGPGPVEEGAVERVGLVTVADNGRSRPELGFFVVPEHQGEGYGREAVSLAIDYAFDVYHHPAIGATTFPSNDASRGLLESLGFEQEGRVRRDWFWKGEYRDYVQYGLMREAWTDGG